MLEKLNEEAYGDLIMSMEDKVAFSKVNQAKTNILKGGCAHTAWKQSTNPKRFKTELRRSSNLHNLN